MRDSKYFTTEEYRTMRRRFLTLTLTSVALTEFLELFRTYSTELEKCI